MKQQVDRNGKYLRVSLFFVFFFIVVTIIYDVFFLSKSLRQKKAKYDGYQFEEIKRKFVIAQRNKEELLSESRRLQAKQKEIKKNINIINSNVWRELISKIEKNRRILNLAFKIKTKSNDHSAEELFDYRSKIEDDISRLMKAKNESEKKIIEMTKIISKFKEINRYNALEEFSSILKTINTFIVAFFGKKTKIIKKEFLEKMAKKTNNFLSSVRVFRNKKEALQIKKKILSCVLILDEREEKKLLTELKNKEFLISKDCDNASNNTFSIRNTLLSRKVLTAKSERIIL